MLMHTPHPYEMNQQGEIRIWVMSNMNLVKKYKKMMFFLLKMDDKNNTSPTYLYTSGKHKKETKYKKEWKILYKKGRE